MDPKNIDISRYSELEKAAKEARIRKDLINHSWEHTVRVVKNIIWLSEIYHPKMVHRIVKGGLYHDTGRKNDVYDPNHGNVSTQIYLLSEIKPWDEIVYSVAFAIRNHNIHKTPDGKPSIVDNHFIPRDIDPMFAKILWDADRLDLLRYGGKVNTDLLNLDASKEYANSIEHLKIYESFLKRNMKGNNH